MLCSCSTHKRHLFLICSSADKLTLLRFFLWTMQFTHTLTMHRKTPLYIPLSSSPLQPFCLMLSNEMVCECARTIVSAYTFGSALISRPYMKTISENLSVTIYCSTIYIYKAATRRIESQGKECYIWRENAYWGIMRCLGVYFLIS